MKGGTREDEGGWKSIKGDEIGQDMMKGGERG